MMSLSPFCSRCRRGHARTQEWLLIYRISPLQSRKDPMTRHDAGRLLQPSVLQAGPVGFRRPEELWQSLQPTRNHAAGDHATPPPTSPPRLPVQPLTELLRSYGGLGGPAPSRPEQTPCWECWCAAGSTTFTVEEDGRSQLPVQVRKDDSRMTIEPAQAR